MLSPREVLDWDNYFLEMCNIVSKRSKDPSTQHGAVIVDKNHKVVSTGYNGGCRKIDDNLIDWSRPNKYSYIIHAEENALWTANRKNLEDCTLYVTGRPCSRCMLRIVHVGISRIVFGDRASQCVDNLDWEISKNITRLSGVALESLGGGDFSHIYSPKNGRA